MTTKSSKLTTENDAAQELFDDVHTSFDAYTGSEPYIFISYSHRDSKIVYAVLVSCMSISTACGTMNPAKMAATSGMNCAKKSEKQKR